MAGPPRSSWGGKVQRRSRQRTAADATSASAEARPPRSCAARALASRLSAAASTAGPDGAALAQLGQLAAGQPALAVGHERAQLARAALGRHGLAARLGGVAHGGLDLVVGRAHARLGVGDQLLDALRAPGHGRRARARAHAARTAGLVARAPGTAARLAGLRLGTSARPSATSSARSSSAIRCQRVPPRLALAFGDVTSARAARHQGAPTPAARRRGPGRCGSSPAARTAASKEPPNGRLAALVDGQTPSR